MQSSNSVVGQRSQEQPAPYNITATGTQATQPQSVNGAKTQQNSDGAESLTPRQEPQGEESQLQETSPKHQGISNNQYFRQTSGADDKAATAVCIRHKPQSNSVPVQSSQCIQHNVKPSQSRSLDSSTSQIDGMFYGISAPQYRSPPQYGVVTAAASNKVNTMQDKLVPNSATFINNGQVRNGNVILPYPQGNEPLLPPPPEYPGNRADIRRSYEVLDRMSTSQTGSLSSSQPELANMSSSTSPSHLTSNNGAAPPYPTSAGNQKQVHADQQQDFAAIAARASKMVEILSEENKGLRNELECYYRKVSKLQKFEFELQKVHEAHDNLVKSSVKKEGLEKAIRARQDMDIKQLEEASRKSQEKVLMLEQRLGDQGSMLTDMSQLITQHEETILHLNKLVSEQKDTINQSHNVIKELTAELQGERTQSKLYAEELDAYKSNASVTMEEESEVKMAALTQSTKDSERIIHEAQAEKLRYMDEAHQACKRVALLEAKLKALEASCAEKDAVVRVLQRRQRSNLSGRGQASPSPAPAQHVRRISEPSSSTTDKMSHLRVDSRVAADEPLQTQTWQV